MLEEPMAREVVAEIRDLSAARGWHAVGQLAADMLSGHGDRALVLVEGSNVDADAFRRWVSEAVPEAPDSAGPEQITAPPFRALFAEKLLAVFDARRVLEAAEVNMILEHFVSRPLDSFAIVFVNAERLESDEELDLMERAIFRVLIPGPTQDWRHQDLAAYRCYFWNDAPARPFLAERCRRDRDELSALLRRPLTALDRESLDRDRAVHLVDFAQEHLSAPEPLASTTPSIDDPHAELRRKIRRRLDAEAASLGREVTASLLRLEQKLLLTVDQSEKRKDLPGRLDDAVTAWRQDIDAELAARAREITAEMQSMLPAAQTLSMPARMPSLRQPAVPPEHQWGPAIKVLAAVTALSLLPVSTFSSLLSAGCFTASLLHRERRLTSELHRSARQAIHDMIGRTIPDMRAGVHRAIADYRNRLISGLLESETAIAAAAAAPSAQPESDRERLLSYRRRL